MKCYILCEAGDVEKRRHRHLYVCGMALALAMRSRRNCLSRCGRLGVGEETIEYPHTLPRSSAQSASWRLIRGSENRRSDLR